MRIAIIGASGFIGSAVTDYLLRNTRHSLVLFSHKASKLHFTPAQEKRLRHVDGNVLRADDIMAALKSCDMAVYLVHLMGNGEAKTGFSAAEATAARNFAAACQACDIARVVYVGGMGDDDDTPTEHLSSRLGTGKVIREQVKQLIELRTPMVIGEGGAGFEVLKSFADTWHIMPVPRWGRAVTQPITVNDVARYVAASLDWSDDKHLSLAIGGPERLSYVQIARRYAQWRRTWLWIVPLPLVNQAMAAWVLRLFRRNAFAMTVADMIGSAGYSTTVGVEAERTFPGIDPEPIERAF